MGSKPPVLGILVGGQSRRFPGGKLRARLGSQSLLATCIQNLQFVAVRLVLVGHPPSEAPLPPLAQGVSWEHIEDPAPGAGPLGGLLALAQVSPEGFLVTAGDMPFLDPRVLATLWRHSGAAAACLTTPSGPRPLPAAFWPGGYERLTNLAEQRPAPGPRRLLEELAVRHVSADNLGVPEEQLQEWLRDIDTPEELKSVQTRSK